jgi:hypothetical protein
LRQDVCKAHEADELSKLFRAPAQANLATPPPRGELEPGESVDRHCVGVRVAHIAEDHFRAGSFEQSADTLAEPGQVAEGNGTRK